MAKPFYRATLTGSKPFASFAIPGVSPSVVVTRRGALLDAETAKKLKAALKAGAIEGISADDVAIVAVDTPAGSKVSADTDDDAAQQVEALTAERDEAAQAAADFKDERDALAQQVEALTAAQAETDASKLATDILDSLTVPELTKLAGTRKVEISSGAAKADIIAALTAPAA